VVVLLNILVYLYNGPLDPHGNRLSAYMLIPRELTRGSSLGAYPAVAPWFTIFTAMFMHANPLHIAGNMLYLWIFGNNIEDVLGHAKFLFFYLVAGLVAALAQVYMSPVSNIPMIGASGAVAGVLGAYLILFPRARVLTLVFIVFFIQVVALPAELVLGFWIVLQVLNGVLSPVTQGGVAYAAHVGGFAAGVAMIMIMGGRRRIGNLRSVDYDGGGWYR
jgi:membrane associated rhomboid family serine protease